MINSDVTRTMSVAEATENSRRMNYGVERAVVLTQRLDAMIDDVIDDCYFCSRVRNMVSSSESAFEINSRVRNFQKKNSSCFGPKLSQTRSMHLYL